MEHFSVVKIYDVFTLQIKIYSLNKVMNLKNLNMKIIQNKVNLTNSYVNLTFI